MSSHDLYLLAPEISLAALAVILVLVDLVVRKKTVLPILAVLGLAVTPRIQPAALVRPVCRRHNADARHVQHSRR